MTSVSVDESTGGGNGQENVAIALGLVCAAGASTGIGAAVVFFPSLVKLSSRRVLASSLGFSAGVMTYVSFAEIFTKSIGSFENAGNTGDEAYVYATFCFFLGVVFMMIMNFLVTLLMGHHHDHHHRPHIDFDDGDLDADLRSIATGRKRSKNRTDGNATSDTNQKLSSGLTVPDGSQEDVPTESVAFENNAGRNQLSSPQHGAVPDSQAAFDHIQPERTAQKAIGYPSGHRNGSSSATTDSNSNSGDEEEGGFDKRQHGRQQRYYHGKERPVQRTASADDADDEGFTIKASSKLVQLARQKVEEQREMRATTKLREQQAEAEKKQAEEEGNKRLVRMGVNTAIAIGLHNFPEGLATFVAAVNDPAVGAVLATAIAIHNIPEGLCVALPMYYASGNRLQSFLWALLSGASEFVAALLGWAILANSFSHELYAILFGMVAGMMVMISIKELLPTAHFYDPADTVVTNSFIGGMALMALSLILFAL